MNLFGSSTTISRITSNLFIGSYDSLNMDKIRQFGISLIINCAKELPKINIPGVEVIKLDVDDIPCEKIENYFDQCADLIRNVKIRNNGNVLVHCAAGVSRSATICLAYLMKHQGMSLRRAYSYMKIKRPIIRPNVGFFKQLIDYEKKLYGNNTVSLVSSQLGLLPDVYADSMFRGRHIPPPAYSSYSSYPHVSSRFRYTNGNTMPHRFGNDLGRRWSP